MTRIRALLIKELLDLRQHPGVFAPAALTGAIALVLPFVVAIVIPRMTGERLADSADLAMAVELLRAQGFGDGVSPEGRAQATIFQQFLPLLALAPVAAAMSIAAYTVVGEKQARSLEPLLATPITTFELLAAKVLSALLPALALAAGGIALYAAGIAVTAEPGVASILLAPQSLGVILVLGPLAALAALQMAVCVSSRTNDARTAQQAGALVIVPLAVALVGQLTGAFQLNGRVLAVVAGILIVVNAALARIGVALFDRETILTRWK